MSLRRWLRLRRIKRARRRRPDPREREIQRRQVIADRAYHQARNAVSRWRTQTLEMGRQYEQWRRS